MYNFQIEIAFIIAYLFGSLSSAIIVSRLLGLPDPRSQGSKNPGATNVLRIGGKIPALLTLLGDVFKGTLPVLFVKWYGLTPIGIALTAFAAFIGHLYPIFFRFEGGKGVATFIGVLIAISWPASIAVISTWIGVAIFFRYSSLASISSAILAPIYIWYFTNNLTYTLTFAAMSLILIWRHESNIKKLLAGTENKLGSKRV